MKEDFSSLSAHMREFGMAMLTRAVIDATFAEIERPFAHPISSKYLRSWNGNSF
jgi:hypothetical protein